MGNKKQTGSNISHLASSVLRDPHASGIQKSLAGSALSQSSTNKSTGTSLEDKASKVLQSSKYSDVTKSLAGSVLSQSENNR